MPRHQKGSAARSGLITIGVIALLLAIAAGMLPKGFSADISKIGQGSNAAVLIHNKETVVSQELMTVLNKIRSDYEPTTLFLAVDIATPEGKSFADAQGASDGTVLLFGPDGARRGVVATTDETSLRASLDAAFKR